MMELLQTLRKIRACEGDAAAQLLLEKYVAQAVSAERERVLSWCAKVQAHHEAKPKTDDEVEQAFVDGEACGAEDCIEAIRAEGAWPS